MNLYRKFAFFYLIIIFITAQNYYSQVDTAWTKSFNYGTYNRGISVFETDDSSYLTLGYTSWSSSESILIKTDLIGNTKWVKKFNNSVYGKFDHMQASKDRNFYVVGNGFISTKLYKFDLEGNIKWSLLLNNFDGKDTLNIFPEDTLIYVSEIINDENNGVYLIGKYGDLEPKLWIASVNSEGKFNWAKIIQTTMWVDSYHLHFLKSSEGFFIAGNEQAGSNTLFFLLTDKFGNLLVEKSYRPDDVLSQSFNSISYVFNESQDSGYVLTGEQMGNLALIRTDLWGNVIWEKTYDRYTPAMQFGNKVITVPWGYVIIGGTGDNTNPKTFILKTDGEGNILWENICDNSYGQSIMSTNDNGYIACGTKAQKDIWLFKLKSTPLAVINGDKNWYDLDWDGKAFGQLDGASSTSPNGFQIVGYSWSINDSIVSTESIVNLELPTGSTEIKLKVTDEYGISAEKVFTVQVCSFKMETNGSISSSISTIGDSIFFATSTDDQIYCFDRNNNIKWSLMTGGDIQSTTTIGPDNNIYVGSSDTRLYNFDLEGNFLWDKPVGGIVTASPAITKNGNLYIGTSTNRLYSIKSEDGSIKWNYLTSGPINSSASVSKFGEIYFGSNDQYFYSLKSSGELNWKFKTNGEIHSSPALDAFGKIYFGSKDGYLYSLSNSGEVEWKYKTNGAIISSPVLDESGNIYFGSGDGYFYSLNSNGELLWKFNSQSPANGNPSIALNGDIIYGCDDGSIIALNKNGEMKWKFKANSAVQGASLITADGRVYVGSSDNNVYGFIDPKYQNISEGFYALQWPTFQKDFQRTGSLYDSETSIKLDENNSIINSFNLFQNYPNPFNPSTIIKFEIAQDAKVVFNIFSVTGEKIKTISEDLNSSGYYSVEWNGLNDKNEQVGSGIYIFQMNAFSANNTFSKSIKMLKLK
ncbi:MAG: PQQ-binding-like beta-propeller repeat protein [Ignavibacteriae bacterium]|nr:PQQ-binding-like beta-propeller repeat protein [Ignavibacteriota bacterium]